MSVLGVVAEFNPFHNGHGYLLEQAKNHLGDFESVICVMSGNFLQRGQPAMCNKWARAQMAILGGADLVLELPFCFAVRSAYYFARGAVELLARTGVVTHIAFGSEHGNLQNLQEISQIITEEPEEFQQQLKKQLSLGLSFPVARAKALEQYFSNIDGIAEILSAPNNILALEYLRIIQEQKLPLIPITIKRTGTSYHSDELSAFASATAIRNGLMTFGPEKIHPFLPESSFNIIQQEISCGRCPVFVDSLEQIILARLRLISTRELSEILDVTEGLENRFKDAAAFSASLKDLLAAVKSKRYSLTRINRSLLYILFNLTQTCLYLQPQ
jgi:predicted nucleotidyltransferase